MTFNDFRRYEYDHDKAFMTVADTGLKHMSNTFHKQQIMYNMTSV